MVLNSLSEGLHRLDLGQDCAAFMVLDLKGFEVRLHMLVQVAVLFQIGIVLNVEH